MDVSHLVLLAAVPTWLKPLWVVGVGLLVVVAVLAALGACCGWRPRRSSAIAWVTAKESMAQAVFPLLLAIGVFGLVLFPFIPQHTLGEDIKSVQDNGLTLIMILSIGLALWTASVSIAEEIEGRTALTLLSKPVGRRQFILGKFVGILIPVMIMFLVLGAIFLASVSFKVVYDARETGQAEPTATACWIEMVRIAPGLLLSFMEAAVLTAISVAISTRLPMLANLVICVVIYALGNLVPIIADSSVGKNEFVKFVADMMSAVFPLLDYFNSATAISGGRAVPLAYLGWAGLYCFLLCCFAMLWALLSFETRDLA